MRSKRVLGGSLVVAAAAAVLSLPQSARPGAAKLTAALAPFTVGISGPTSVEFDPCCIPSFQPYTFTFGYVGPPLGPPPDQAETRFTIRTSENTQGVRVDQWLPDGGQGVADCTTEMGPATFWGHQWFDFSCRLIFTQSRTTQTLNALIRPSGKTGTGTINVSLSTGESASWTTEYIRLQP